jgi:hypothetical protein
MIHTGVDSGKISGAAFSTGMLAGCGVLFLRLIEANFLSRETLPMSRLHRLASDRNTILDSSARGEQSVFETRRSITANTLRFAEETLRGWVPGSHFELCIFVDAKEPLLFSYFDSNNDIRARSMAEREGDPSYYIDKGYEVTALLRHPTSHVRVVTDTLDAKSKYVFTTAEQRRQLRSTLLLCLDLATPCALVITSNERNAFDEADDKLMSFVKYIGRLIRFDLFEDGFVHRIREQQPDLFSAPAARSSWAGPQPQSQ